MVYKIIDVSKYQGHIDWPTVKPQIDGAVIRIGYKGYGSTGNIVYDPLAFANIKGCIENEIPYGVYFLSQAKTYAEGAQEAEWVHSALRQFGTRPLLPVFIDSEWSNPDHSGRADGLSKAERTQAVLGFLETLEKLNYFTGIYASTSWFASNLEDSQLSRFAHWVADYRGYCGYKGAKVMWQYTSGGAVAGISGRVDLNEAYIDFPVAIKAKGLNGYIQEVDPISLEPVRLVVGFASPGDIKQVEQLLANLSIDFETTDGFIYTQPASTGDQISIIELCENLGLPVKEFAPVIMTEEAGNIPPHGVENWLKRLLDLIFDFIFGD